MLFPQYLVLVIFTLFFIEPANSGTPEIAPEENSSLVRKKTVIYHDGVKQMRFADNASLFKERWDTLQQTCFWKTIVQLTSDSAIINVASTRQQLLKIDFREWMRKTETEKTQFKKELCAINGIDEASHLFVTSGKKEFYDQKNTFPFIDKAVSVFEKNYTDPWYAQTILLIESPGKTRAYSYTGAFGPFQLMPYVARKYGLRVSRYRDDRADIQKSALAASKLLRNVCIPYVKNLLDAKCIDYNETDLWFRLLVLHSYHAGFGNVKGVIEKINPEKGSMELIRQMWQTEYRGFKNESQNYSQIALASIMAFEEFTGHSADTVFMVQGDRLLKNYTLNLTNPSASFSYLQSCMNFYEQDLMDGIIPFEYFAERAEKVQEEMTALKNLETSGKTTGVAINPVSEARMVQIGNSLLKKRKTAEAIKLLHFTLNQFPSSSAALDSLAHAYRMTGNHSLAAKYQSKAENISGENP
jgi:tetratricopeptide (TPR) repeat protein